jgi:hypothetical protein
MSWLKALVRHKRYHAASVVAYVLSAPLVFTIWRESVLAVLVISVETALSTHLGAWAAEDAAESS